MAQPNNPLTDLFGAAASAFKAASALKAASDAGMCAACTKNPVEPPSKICEECAGKAADVVSIAAAPTIDRAASALGDALADGVRDLLRGRR